MAELTLRLPDSITETEAQLMLAMKLFEIGRLSCGQAADFAGYSKPAFMLGKHRIPVFDQSAADLASDLSNA